MESIDQIEQILSEYESRVGLNEFKNPLDKDELDNYLTMNRDVLEKFSYEECGYIAYRLGQFSFHIRRAQNREKARIRWAEKRIDVLIAGELNNYNGYGYREKAPQAIKGNEAAVKVERILINAGQRFDRLDGLYENIKNLSLQIKDIGWNKKNAESKDS